MNNQCFTDSIYVKHYKKVGDNGSLESIADGRRQNNSDLPLKMRSKVIAYHTCILVIVLKLACKVD